MKDSDKTAKTRVSVTLTKPYIDALDRLVTEGIYLRRGEVVLEGLRLILRRYRLDPFRLYERPLEEEGEEEASQRDFIHGFWNKIQS